MFNRVGVFYNQLKEQVAPLAKEVVSLLHTQHVQAAVLTTLDNLENTDLVISMGGDGTMLRCARACAPKNIPVFGINCGTLGFLASAEKAQIPQALHMLLKGDCTTRSLLMLSVTVHQKGRVHHFTALNDCVLRAAHMRAFFVQATYNQTAIPSYFGDGVIIATPTGSTAYSLAAGGPIVAPSLEVFVLTPVCPHSLHQRPLVLNAQGTLVLKPSFKNPEDSALISFDGQIHLPLSSGDELEIVRAPFQATLLTSPQRGFFSVLHKKFNWGEE